MISFAVSRDDLDRLAWAGATLAIDLRDSDGRIALRKGHVLQLADAATLRELPWRELHVVAPGADDLGERDAGAQLAALAAGAGCRVGSPITGHWPIVAAHRGILRVRVDALTSVNAIGPLAVYTLFDGQVVDGGEAVARAKVVPFAVARGDLEVAGARARETGGLVAVTPFVATRVGAVVCESLGESAAARFRAALEEKVRWLGGTLLEPAFVASAADAVAAGIATMRDGEAGIVVVAGLRPKDPLDPAYVALDRLGAVMVRRGLPAHPGSLAWLARLGEIPVVGMPSCGLFSQATVFDLVLPRLLTGETVGIAELAALGHGGFLTHDMAFRFPPYRPARDRGEVE